LMKKRKEMIWLYLFIPGIAIYFEKRSGMTAPAENSQKDHLAVILQRNEKIHMEDNAEIKRASKKQLGRLLECPGFVMILFFLFLLFLRLAFSFVCIVPTLFSRFDADKLEIDRKFIHIDAGNPHPH